MLDFTKELSLNKVIYNNGYESLFDPIENPLRDLDNISMIFEQAFPFKMNEANEEQNFPEYKKEIAAKENLFNPEFNYKDQNDKVENKYLETSMVLDEINEDYMKINGETKKIFEIAKEAKPNKKSFPSYPRIDDYKIYWRTKINKYIVETINEFIEQSDLPTEFKKKKIHAPSYKMFTINVRCASTFDDLSKTISDILSLGHESQEKQRQNYENIQAINAHNLNHPSQSVQKIVDFLTKTYEQIIDEFYNPQNQRYFELCKDNTAIYHDEEFRKQKGFSLFEKNGLITLFKTYKGNMKGNEKMLGKKRTSKKPEY